MRSRRKVGTSSCRALTSSAPPSLPSARPSTRPSRRPPKRNRSHPECASQKRPCRPTSEVFDMNRFSLSVVFLAAILVNNVSAQDQVITRSADKPVKGAIKTESASGVVVGKDTIAAADIIDILYAAEEVSIGGPYAAAKTAERDSLDASKDAKTRKDKLQLAIDKYQESIGKVADPKAKRHF